MHEDVFRGRRRVALTSMVAAGAVIALAACSSSGGTSGGSGGAATGGASAGNLPASITVVSTNPTTGAPASASGPGVHCAEASTRTKRMPRSTCSS